MLLGQSVDMSDFAEMLSIYAGRIVLNTTGIQGLFDIKMPRFGPGQLAAQSVDKKPITGGDGIREKVVEAQALPTIFTVLDQFGLKLESTKAPVEVIVIDSLQKPSD